MKLGFLTAPFPETPLMDVADWASSVGFEVLEIACWPRTTGPSRRYAGTSHIDVANLSDDQATEIVDEIAAKGLSVSGLGFYPNPLHPDPAHRETVIGHLKKVMVAASRMGVPLVNTFMGGDASKSQDENWETALQVWPDIVKAAQDNGVKLTIENCPMIFSRDEWPAGHNIAWSPYIWRRILEQWGGTVGLNYDPSHLVWLMIDQERFIKEFGPHILHFQAKDLEIDPDGLYERGTLSVGMVPVPTAAAGGFLKKQPADRDPCGCVAMRRDFASSMRARIFSGSSRVSRRVAPSNNSPSLNEV